MLSLVESQDDDIDEQALGEIASTLEKMKDGDESKEETLTALVRATRNMDFLSISSRLKQALDDALSTPGPNSRHHLLLAEALRVRLVGCYVQIIGLIAESITEMQIGLPQNVYNLSKALSDFAFHLDPFDPGKLQTACRTLIAEVNPTLGVMPGVTYIAEDIEAARQEGYEKGYERGRIRGSSRTSPRRMKDLDL
jgi:hypothetical protein